MIFVDTWAWVALADRRDQYHQQAKATHQRLSQAAERYVTSDDVMGETITYLYDALLPAHAEAFLKAIFQETDSGYYLLVHVSPEQFQRAWNLRQKYHDKPDIAFIDFTSMIVMQDLGITEIFTGDSHFLHVGLGFQSCLEAEHALEEASCTDADILDHCRNGKDHVRGCWVVDLILGKE